MAVADSGAPDPLWSVKPVIGRLLHRGRDFTDPESLLGAICARVRKAGMPLDRTNVFISTLYPKYFGFGRAWEDGVAQTYFGARNDRESDTVVQSTMGPIVNGERAIRRHL